MSGLRAVVVCLACFGPLTSFAEEPPGDAGVAPGAMVEPSSPPDALEPLDAGAAGIPPTPIAPTVDAGTPTSGSAEAQVAAVVQRVSNTSLLFEELALRADGALSVGDRAWLRATLAIGIWPQPSGSYLLRDTGTVLSLGTGAPGSRLGELSFSVAPLRSPRVRPTFDWADTWGETTMLLGAMPTFVLAWRNERVSTWAAARFGSGWSSLTNLTEPWWSGLLGASLSLGKGWSLEGRGAVYDRGDNTSLGYQDIKQRVVAGGGSARVGWSLGGGVEPAWDRVTYSDDPECFERPFARRLETEPLAATVLLESGYATQSLGDPDVLGEAKLEPAAYGDLQARLRRGGLRLYATLRARSTSLVVFDGPGFPQYWATARSSTAAPELSAIAGAELRLASWVSPSLLLRVRRPATLGVSTADSGGNAPPPGSAVSRTLVVFGPGRYAIVPSGGEVQSELTATASLTLEPSADVLVLLDLDGRYDPYPNARFPDLWPYVTRPPWGLNLSLSGSATLLVHFH